MGRKSSVWVVFLIVLSLSAIGAAQKTYPEVGYRQASRHIGEIVWVEGKVLRTEDGSQGTFLLFSANKKYVRVLIPKANVKDFEGSIKHRYAGKKIKAVGQINQYGDSLVLAVDEPKRIKIVEEAS